MSRIALILTQGIMTGGKRVYLYLYLYVYLYVYLLTHAILTGGERGRSGRAGGCHGILSPIPRKGVQFEDSPRQNAPPRRSVNAAPQEWGEDGGGGARRGGPSPLREEGGEEDMYLPKIQLYQQSVHQRRIERIRCVCERVSVCVRV
jgi:hypothetical protein